MALELATGRKKWVTEDSLPLYIELVRSAGWWDTLDWIAAHLISPLLRQNRQLEALLIEWRRDEGMWVRRAALLSQLNHKTAVNRELLAETILLLSGEKEFFIRKAIGWVLRDVSYSFPDWVAAFVETHHDALSGLSRREAMKDIDRARTQNPSAD